MDQVLRAAVRERHRHAHVAAELVHVRRDGQGLDIDRDEPARLDLDVRVARRELEVGVRRVVPVQRLLDRLAREVEADARAVDLGLAGGVVVDLEDDVGLAREPLTDPVGKMAGLVPGGPEAQLLEASMPGPANEV